MNTSAASKNTNGPDFRGNYGNAIIMNTSSETKTKQTAFGNTSQTTRPNGPPTGKTPYQKHWCGPRNGGQPQGVAPTVAPTVTISDGCRASYATHNPLHIDVEKRIYMRYT